MAGWVRLPILKINKKPKQMNINREKTTIRIILHTSTRSNNKFPLQMALFHCSLGGICEEYDVDFFRLIIFFFLSLLLCFCFIFVQQFQFYFLRLSWRKDSVPGCGPPVPPFAVEAAVPCRWLQARRRCIGRPNQTR